MPASTPARPPSSWGWGQSGLCGVLAARQLGAERDPCPGTRPGRRRQQFGATDVVAERGKKPVERVRELTDGVGADAVLECVGAAESMQTAIMVARPGGTRRLRRRPARHRRTVRPDVPPQHRSVGGMAPVRKYLSDLIDLVTSGEIDPSPVFDLTPPMSESPDG